MTDLPDVDLVEWYIDELLDGLLTAAESRVGCDLEELVAAWREVFRQSLASFVVMRRVVDTWAQGCSGS